MSDNLNLQSGDSLKIMEMRAQLWGSFILFCHTFFPVVTGREFRLSNPLGRESHFITISRGLTHVTRNPSTNLMINVPPGSGKSTIVAMWIAWTMSRWPMSNFLYISYGKTLATKHTEFIRRIITNSYYKAIFDARVRWDSKSKEDFKLEQGGAVKAFGSSGAVTGQDAGLPNFSEFTGAVIMDDMHKPDEVYSDTIRQSVIENYRETISQRPRGPNVPMIYIGQRLHEDDLPAFLLSGKDERKWETIILKALDDAGNALYPEVNSLESLREKQAKSPYMFAGQYQQDPIPAGGALFKERDFSLLTEEPELLVTFITADTAETAKSYNDATAFGFWGIYKIKYGEKETGQLGLHWIDAQEIRVEPRDLQESFLSFYGDCMLHKVPPTMAAIEKKSTGTTLVSVLSDMRGLAIREVKRTKASGSKTARYLEMQPIIASKQVSFTEGAKHVDICIQHMLKITANNTHRHDDLADTLYDACKIALIDKTMYADTSDTTDSVSTYLADIFKEQQRARAQARAANQNERYR